jgi:transcriptional regulator of acetoin/glycerol metabolism
MARQKRIEPGDLGLQASTRSVTQSLDDLSLEQVESILIRKALSRAQGNVSHAADALGLSRGALYRRIEKYGL